MQYLLYGANGYTAQLIIKESLKLGLTPILAGRTKAKVEVVANQFSLKSRIFSLDDPETIATHLKDVDVVLNAAGPFSKTALPMVKACMQTQTHYLDITGEVEVFENLKSLNNKAKKAGIMVMPGTGFDVVPSDCLSNYLKEKMPDATHLELAFTSTGGGLSHGTASTMVEQLGNKSLTRRKGKLKKVNLAYKSKKADFVDFKRTVATIPWGDVSTAFTSTQIPNIDVFTAMPKAAITVLKFQTVFNPILRTSFVKKMAQDYVDKHLYGPTEEENRTVTSYLNGEVTNGKQTKSAVLTCAEGYLLTALCSVAITKKVLEGNFKMGYQTPAMAYGWELILEVEGSKFIDL